MTVALSPPYSAPVQLGDGSPHVGFARTNEMRQFAFYVPYAAEVHAVVSVQYGDCELFLSSDDQPPTATHHLVARYHNALHQRARLRPHDDGACAQCEMLLGVYAWRSCAFTITASLGGDNSFSLLEGTPRRDTLSAGAIRRYRFLPLVARDVVLTLSLLAGAPPFLFASADEDAIINTDCVQHTCRDNRAEFVKMPDDPRPLHISSREVREGEPLYIGVSATDNSSFTIVATAPLPLDQREEGGSSVCSFAGRASARDNPKSGARLLHSGGPAGGHRRVARRGHRTDARHRRRRS